MRNYQRRYIRTITTSFLLGNVPIRHTLCGAVMPVFRAVDPLLRYGYGGVPSCHTLRATVMGSESEARRITTPHLLGGVPNRHTLCGTVMVVSLAVIPCAGRLWKCFRRTTTTLCWVGIPSRHFLCGTVMVAFPAVIPFAERSWRCAQPSKPFAGRTWWCYQP